MEENGYRFGVGVLVLSSFLIGLLLVVFFGSMPQFWTKHYTVVINFQSAPGVTVDTPVYKSGVKIGRVSAVKLLERDGGVNLSLELDQNVEVLTKELCRIGSPNLVTQDGKIEFVRETPASLIERFDGAQNSPKDGVLDAQETEVALAPLKDGDYLKGGITVEDPMNMIVNMQDTVGKALASIDRAAQRIDAVGASFQDVLGGSSGNVQAVVSKTKEALDNFNRTADSIRAVLNQVESSRVPEAIAQVLEKMPAILDEAEGVVKQTKVTLKSFEQVGDNFQEVGKTANDAIRNVRDITEPLREEGTRLIETASTTMDNISLLVNDLRQISQRLNSSQGTIGQLIDNPDLYYRAVGTLENIERLTRQLQPAVNDVRVFTDKVSRDPSVVVDLKGLINGRPRGTGLK